MNNNHKDTLQHKGLTYEAFESAWYDRLDQPRSGLDRTQRRYLFYARYNKDRSERVRQAYHMSDDLRIRLEAIKEPQHWMVLTEDWCADSAFCLPVIVAAAQVSHAIELRILRRDENLDIMDQYLTGTSRSIPKLVAFSAAGTELFRWGPRPEQARLLREGLLADGVSGGDVSKRLIEWYEEGGWSQVDTELLALVTAVQHIG